MNVGDSIAVPAKPAWKSYTLWIQAISIAVLVIGLVVENAQIYDLDSRWLATLGIVTAVLTAVRRMLGTIQPIDTSAQLTTQRLTVTSDDGSATTA